MNLRQSIQSGLASILLAGALSTSANADETNNAGYKSMKSSKPLSPPSNFSFSFDGDYDLIDDEVLIEQLKRHEGYRKEAYLDSKNIPTIGIGFNLQKKGAKERITSLGLDYDSVVAKKQSLTDGQIMALFRKDVMQAIYDARKIVTNYNSQPIEIRRVLVDMSFNMGRDKFSKFTKTIEGFHRYDYATAAKEMKDSLWYNQVGNRSKYLVEIVEKTKK